MRIVVSEFVSLDGVMEDPGGAEHFEHGGWTTPYWSDEIAKVKGDELVECDGLLLGRTTYEGFAAAWPSMTEDEGFARMNSLPKYVVSSTLDTVEWNNSQLLKGDVVDEVKQLKQQDGNALVIAGSAMLVQELARNDLIDEYRLTVYPVTLGTGKRLFEGCNVKLELASEQPTGNGVVFLTYRPASGA
jgi:dihydrofolate reductase